MNLVGLVVLVQLVELVNLVELVELVGPPASALVVGGLDCLVVGLRNASILTYFYFNYHCHS